MGAISVFVRRAAVAAVAAVSVLIGSVPVSAQAGGLIDAILSVFGAPPPAASPIQQVPPDVVSAPLRITITPRSLSEFSGVSGYCVRLCDGRYFPLPRLKAASATPAKLCNALCPGSRTMVYWGAPIDEARSSNGTRYPDLTTAFDYRKHIVPNCTCNGNDIFGTAAISIREDIALRSGDVVVTENGAKVFIGSAEGQHQASDFASLKSYSGFSVDQRRKLSEIKITRRATLESGPLNFNARIVFGPASLPSSLLPSANANYGK